MESGASFSWRSRRKTAAIAAGGAGLIAVLGLGAFPVGLLRDTAESRLSKALDAPVEIGALTREQFFSFAPEITVHDVRIGQPEWAGQGDFVKVATATARIPVLSVLTGNITIRSLHISGLGIAMVRDEEGNSNWAGPADRQRDDGHNPLRLENLTIENSRFSLRDARRKLNIAGEIVADGGKGLVVKAAGTFAGAPATIAMQGGRIAGPESGTNWPFEASLTSDLLRLAVKGAMAGALNTGDMIVEVEAKGVSLKYLDHLIEAGLFGTQEIDLNARVRHRNRDWFIERLDGTIGRSEIRAKGSVLKREGRTWIDADIRSPGFDFDDLADDAGQAEARAKEARIGPRVLPDTRIDLSKMGPTDGKITFAIDRLLIRGGSAFRSFQGDLSLRKRVLRLGNARVGLASGYMAGWAKVDSTGAVPILSTELRVEGTSLETLIGDPGMIRGPLRGLVRITGRGSTIREAFAAGDGKIAFVAGGGSINRAAAFVMGRDLGGAVSQGLRDRDARTGLRCAILSFRAAGGRLRPAPLLIDTEISTGRGSGQIDLDGEAIDIVLNGVTRGDATLKLADPIRVGGTLSAPAITVDDRDPASAGSGGGVLRAIGRSVGNALGLRGDDADQVPDLPEAIDCRSLSASALR